jgi:hypothetical protein
MAVYIQSIPRKGAKPRKSDYAMTPRQKAAFSRAALKGIKPKKPKNFGLYGMDMKGEYYMKKKKVGKGVQVTGVKKGASRGGAKRGLHQGRKGGGAGGV